MSLCLKILRRSWRFNRASSSATTSNLEVSSGNTISKEGAVVSSALVHEKSRDFVGRYYSRNFSSDFFVGRRLLSSKVGATDDEDNETLEQEKSSASGVLPEDDANDAFENDCLLELELNGDEDVSEEHLGDEKRTKWRARSELFEAIVSSSSGSLRSVLDTWVKEGKNMSKSEIYEAIYILRKRKLYPKALQLFQWLEANKQLKFTEKDYAYYLDLVSKVHGLQKAEDFIKTIPESFKGEKMYSTLLVNCVLKRNVKRGEDIFRKMKSLKLPLSAFTCNQMLMLYIKQKKKISDILLLMEKDNVKPTLLTYKVLINAKGSSGDMTGMDQIVETMKEEGIEPDVAVQAALASHYIAAGLKEKAKQVMREMEGEDLEANPRVCRQLLTLYADIGESDQVERIWKFCEQTMRYDICASAIVAWGKLKRIDEAEAVFEKHKQKYKTFPMKPFFMLLKVYTDNKMLTKGKDLVKQMVDQGIKMSPPTWDAVVKLFVESGEVGKANLILNKVLADSQMKPMYSTFITILEAYAARGDIHNTEKIFHRIREVGYTPQLRQYEALVLAYTNAKAPAYGMRDRMRADNVFPNKNVAEKLARVNPFRKTLMSGLIDE